MKKRTARSKTRPAGVKRRTAKAKAAKGPPARPKSRARASAKRRTSARAGAATPKRRPAKRETRILAHDKPTRQAARRPRPPEGTEDVGRITGLSQQRTRHHETSPALSAGDLDANWMDAEGSGEESVGGSVATPDQDVVDEIGRALGVEQEPTQPVTSSEEILRERARHRWDLERQASEEDDRRER